MAQQALPLGLLGSLYRETAAVRDAGPTLTRTLHCQSQMQPHVRQGLTLNQTPVGLMANIFVAHYQVPSLPNWCQLSRGGSLAVLLPRSQPRLATPEVCRGFAARPLSLTSSSGPRPLKAPSIQRSDHPKWLRLHWAMFLNSVQLPIPM